MSHSGDLSDDDATSGDEAYTVPDMMSDGKRMRTVWKPGDGDGDPNASVVERSMYLIRGHPTWKIFIGDIPEPLERGTEDEPPHYVYLDDKACYDIHYSDVYTKEEKRRFWPWDFNHQGHIKTGRLNRGRPAYRDDSYLTLGTAPLRGKDKWYTFSGAPEESEYQPVRQKDPKKIEDRMTGGTMFQLDMGADEETDRAPKKKSSTRKSRNT